MEDGSWIDPSADRTDDVEGNIYSHHTRINNQSTYTPTSLTSDKDLFLNLINPHNSGTMSTGIK